MLQYTISFKYSDYPLREVTSTALQVEKLQFIELSDASQVTEEGRAGIRNQSCCLQNMNITPMSKLISTITWRRRSKEALWTDHQGSILFRTWA